MKRVEAYSADDGTLHPNMTECAKKDLGLALDKLQREASGFGQDVISLHAPRAMLRNRVEQLYRLVRVVQTCIADLDHVDEDATDPERIDAAKRQAARDAEAAKRSASASPDLGADGTSAK